MVQNESRKKETKVMEKNWTASTVCDENYVGVGGMDV